MTVVMPLGMRVGASGESFNGALRFMEEFFHEGIHSWRC